MRTIGLSFALLSAYATAQTPPQGWTEKHPASGVVEYTPPDLKEGETLRVAIFPSADRGQLTLSDWTIAQIKRDPAPIGTAKGEPKIETSQPAAVVVSQAFAKGGETLYGVFMGLDQGTKARMLRVTMSGQSGLYTRYSDSINKLVGEAKGTSASATVPNQRGSGTVGASKVYADLLPKMLAPCRIGGPMKEGIYEGPRVSSGKGGKLYEMRLYLYDSGEYFIMTKGEDDKEFHEARFGDGEFKYVPEKGTLGIGGTWDLSNSSYDPSDEHTLYLYDPQGKPFIYGRSDRGLSFLTTILAYKGPVDRPSPKQLEIAKRVSNEAAKRYKWITAPHQGLTLAQIHTIWHDYKVNMDGLGGSVAQNGVYILLKDGTIYDGLPVAPDQFDAPTSRRREPEKWGKWKQSGNQILVNWKDSEGRWDFLKGTPVKPGTPQTKLSGQYSEGESHVNIGGSSWSMWGVTFSNGRFLKYRRGGAGNSQFMINGGAPAINTFYDDDGAVTSALGEGFVVSSNKKVSTRLTRSGSFEIDGYTLTLKFDDGRIIRHPFFIDRNGIWFEGSYLSIDKGR